MASTSIRKLSALAARLCLLTFIGMVIAQFFLDFSYWWAWIPLGLWVLIGFGINRSTSRAESEGANGPAAEPVLTAAPVTGRWKAQNSPADKVPSHGTRAYGQAYAIDIVAEPASGARPGFGWWPSPAAVRTSRRSARPCSPSPTPPSSTPTTISATT
ncbi:hypothetical protein Srufu_041870 [Streptomyces libani subsp. rufus]|nr:hypothetical protein Srufu_041870 [Streptomyces libani subsp. rufus]